MRIHYIGLYILAYHFCVEEHLLPPMWKIGQFQSTGIAATTHEYRQKQREMVLIFCLSSNCCFNLIIPGPNETLPTLKSKGRFRSDSRRSGTAPCQCHNAALVLHVRPWASPLWHFPWAAELQELDDNKTSKGINSPAADQLLRLPQSRWHYHLLPG